MSETLESRTRFVCEAVAKSARLMVGVPDYQTYVDHRRTVHPDLPVMTYPEFFKDFKSTQMVILLCYP